MGVDGSLRAEQNASCCAPVFVLDLYAGAGGLSIGLQDAGFVLAAAVKRDADAAATYRGLHPGVCVLEQEVHNVDFLPWRGVVDVVCGGPHASPLALAESLWVTWIPATDYQP